MEKLVLTLKNDLDERTTCPFAGQNTQQIFIIKASVKLDEVLL